MMRAAILAGCLLAALPAAAQFDPTAEVIVGVSRTRFDPAVIETRRGVRVSFYRVDRGSDWLTVVADDGSFESWKLIPGGHFSHLFPQAGAHGFHLKEHPDVRGTAQVR